MRDSVYSQSSIPFHFKEPETGVHVSRVEGTWSAIKRSFPRGRVRNPFDSSLTEYIWRRAHADTDNLTRAFLKAAADVYFPRTCDIGLEAETGVEDDQGNLDGPT